MDEIAIAYQREAAKAYKKAEAARNKWRWADLINAQAEQAHAFRQQWIWRFGHVPDVEVPHA